jgi:hypothetical protein
VDTPAQTAKRLGMAQVKRHANPEWMELMLDLVWEVCLTYRQFTTDEVYDKYFAIPKEKRPWTHDDRAMGPVMARAAKLGFCKLANMRPIPSRRRTLHASPISVWDSLIYEGE